MHGNRSRHTTIQNWLTAAENLKGEASGKEEMQETVVRLTASAEAVYSLRNRWRRKGLR